MATTNNELTHYVHRRGRRRALSCNLGPRSMSRQPPTYNLTQFGKKHPRRYPEFDNRHPNGTHVFNMSFSSSESASSLCSSSVFLLPSYPFPGSDKNRSSYRPTIRHFDHVKITNVLLFKQKLLQQFEITMGIYYQDNVIVWSGGDCIYRTHNG
jgi:hypothetical protein